MIIVLIYDKINLEDKMNYRISARYNSILKFTKIKKKNANIRYFL